METGIEGFKTVRGRRYEVKHECAWNRTNSNEIEKANTRWNTTKSTPRDEQLGNIEKEEEAYRLPHDHDHREKKRKFCA